MHVTLKVKLPEFLLNSQPFYQAFYSCTFLHDILPIFTIKLLKSLSYMKVTKELSAYGTVVRM